MTTTEITHGTRLRVRDASGCWHERVAASPLEGCYVDGKLKHDFAGVYVRREDAPDDDGIFWPLEDVEVVGSNEEFERFEALTRKLVNTPKSASSPTNESEES